MATATAFGSITIIDVTDIGEFSVYPMSNLPLSVIYSPDQDTYTPSWSTNNLVLTPAVYYAGKSLTLGTSGLSISWQKMEGIASATMGSHEVTDSKGVLTVNENQFNENSSIITYTVTATYIEPSSKTTLTAQGQISFSLVKMASEARNVTVNGNNIFKYNSSGSCDITSTTLVATVTDNLTVTDWEYSNNDGSSWTSFNNAKSSLTIAEGSDIFSNDRVLVRVVAQDKRNVEVFYYDYITVFKLRDGTAAGNNLALSNESQQIPCDSDGNPTSAAFKLANTSVSIYESGKDITSEYAITATPNGVLGAWSTSSTQAPTGNANASQKGDYIYYWVTGWASSNTSEVGEVLFTATKGTETLTKKMSLIKIKTGADGETPTVYSLDLSDLVVNKSFSYSSTPDENGNYTVTATTYSPTSIVATISKAIGNTTSPFDGYVKVYKDGNTTPIAYGTATSGKYTLSGIGSTHVPTSYLTFELYSGGGASDRLLDSQNVIITSDGFKGGQGEQGNDGESAINLVLGNYSDTISVTTAYKPSSATTLTIPFAVYEGTKKIAATITAPNAAITMGGTTITPTVASSTASADGTLTYSLTTSQVIGDSSKKNGSKSLTFSYTTSDGKSGTVTGTYSWALSVAAINGTSPIMLQVFTPNGYVFSNGNGTLGITAQLMNGSNIQTSNVTYEWAKYTNGNYATISGENSSTLSVSGENVNGYASYRCAAKYLGKTYYGYASLMDKTDPVQVSILSTVGTQIVNGQGIGAVYAMVTRNGDEIDALKTTNFVISKPPSMTTNTLYYYMDSTAKSVKLMKATSTTAWSDVTSSNENQYTGTYTWSYRNANNESITEGTPSTTGKIVYIDATLINKKIVIDVEVEI